MKLIIEGDALEIADLVEIICNRLKEEDEDMDADMSSSENGFLSIGNFANISAERSRLGMTIEDLAQTLGVTRKTIYNWITKGDIPQSKLEQMSEIFHCSIDYLLSHKLNGKEPIHEATNPHG